MKMKLINNLPMAVAAFAIVSAALPEATPIFGSEAAYAQRATATKKKTRTRKVPAMSQAIHKKMQVAQEALEAKDYVEAEKLLNALLKAKRINDYEKATVWQLKSSLAYEKEDMAGTIEGYEMVLSFVDSIPEGQEMQILFGLAQLYFAEENYDKSLSYLKRWEPRVETIGITQLMFIGQLYYVRNEFQKSLDYVYRAIKDADAVDTIEVRESWYQLAMSSHWELNDFHKVRDVLEILLINWPKPLYWTQLAGVYGEIGEEEISFSLTEAAYKQGFLDDKEIQLVNLAQILIARQAPIKATWVLKNAFKEDRVKQSAKNMKTYGQAYMMASEYDLAIEPLQNAASKGADGDLWFQIGQVLVQLDRYSEAIPAFQSAIKELSKKVTIRDKNGKTRKDTKVADKIFNARMQIGTAQTELKKFADARKTFTSARKLASSERQRKIVKQWSNYLKAEEAREKMLTGDY